jgi:glycosyltransferase involved in cell wall biosynthesis
MAATARGPATCSNAPEVSIVIPVHDEEPILRDAVRELGERLSDCDWRAEIWLAENGSADATAELARSLGESDPRVHAFSIGRADYGRALREGIGRARGAIVICEEIDLCDVGFHRRAVELLRREPVDLVIGSKLVAGAEDHRPLGRHLASLAYNATLRALLGFRGTDTHGLKAFRRERVAPIAARCVVDGDVFASELVLRAWREGLSVREIPVRLVEKRPPSVGVWRRVPRVLVHLGRLWWALGARSGAGSPAPR